MHSPRSKHEELQIKFIVTSGFEVYNRNSFQAPRKEADVEGDATKDPSSVWMETIRGEKSADALGVAQIQVDHKVVVTAIRFFGDPGTQTRSLPFSRISFSDLVHI